MLNATAEAMGIGPNIIIEVAGVGSFARAYEDLIEQGDVDGVVVNAPADELYDAVSVFAEVEGRGYDHVHSDGSRGGLFRVFTWIGYGGDDQALGDEVFLRRAEGWLTYPFLFHPKMRFGEESVLLGTTQQFVDGFTRRFGSEPTHTNALSANSCLNLRQAIEIAATESPTVPSSAEILAGLANVSAETVRAFIRLSVADR